MRIIAKTYILDVLGNARTGLSSGTLPSPTVPHMSVSSLRVQDQGPRGCGRMKPAMAWQPYDHGDSVPYTGPNLFQWNQAITSSSTTNIWKVRELHKFSLFFQHPGSLSHPSILCFLNLLWHCFFFFLYALSLTPVKKRSERQGFRKIVNSKGSALCPWTHTLKLQETKRRQILWTWKWPPWGQCPGGSGGAQKLWENSSLFLLLPVSFWEDAQPTHFWSGSLNSAGGSAQCHVPCKGGSHGAQMPDLYLLPLQTPGCEVNRLGDNCFPEYLHMYTFTNLTLCYTLPSKNICFIFLNFVLSGLLTNHWSPV